MKHSVIGKGEVGKALQAILKCNAFDLGEDYEVSKVIHICFPYSKDFERFVNYYKELFRAEYIVIHSTVPVGTSSKLNALHSPIRGVHPHLETSLTTFLKYIGGPDAHVIATELRQYGIICETTEKAETTELMKLVDTTSYGVNILIEKEIHRLCKEYDVPFDKVYSDANFTYNRGYANMKMPQFAKYNLKHIDGKIGGHCINENAELLDSWMNDLIKEKNASL